MQDQISRPEGETKDEVYNPQLEYLSEPFTWDDVPDFDLEIQKLEASLEIAGDVSTRAVQLRNLGELTLTGIREDTQDLDRSIVLFEQLIDLESVDDASYTDSLMRLGVLHENKFDRTGNLEDLDSCLKRSQDALIVLGSGKSHKRAEVLLNLGTAYGKRFDRLGDSDDLDCSIVYYSGAVEASPDDTSPLERYGLLFHLGLGHTKRYQNLDSREDLDISIRVLKSAVDLVVEHSAFQTSANETLGMLYQQKFNRTRDMLGVRALYHSLKSKTFALALTQVLAICCGFLTPLSSILFTVKIISEVEDVSIEQDSWFGVRRQGATSFNVWDTWRMQEDMGSLMLFQNSSELRYPEGTYRDLVYPIVKLNDAVQDWTGRVSVHLTLPAARLSPECFQLSDFKANPDSEVADEDHIIASYTEEIICPNGLGQAALTRDIRVALGNETNPRYFAKTMSSQDYAMLIRKLCKEDDDENTNYRPWTVETFMWGAISDSKKSFDHIEGWRCNYTWTEVPTQFTYRSSNSQPQLDYGRPPVSDDTKAKPWEPYFSTPNMDFLQPDFSIQDSQAAEVGEAFAPLIKPFGPLGLNEFGDSSKTDYILNTIHFRRGIVAAQYANVKNRLKLNDTSDTEPTNHPTTLPSNGSITRTNKRRLVQNFGITIAIIVILALAFIVNLWALGSRMMKRFVGVESDFLLDLNMKGVCPDEFNSLVSWHNLLHGAAGSTVLPRDSQYMSTSHTCKELAGVEFRIGWFYFNGLKGKYFTIGSLNDPSCEYIGRYER
ncbi:unnamed protein product [Clonostachys rhizophaga]|uniref:Uncharacterized protein n=1 Tax=Clonostachys rhizophaga TaxID=160324 RepID=A0A9N9V9S4_9HYPO|nr:unnamed protein product [Clonostachys rhizophaga]